MILKKNTCNRRFMKIFQRSVLMVIVMMGAGGMGKSFAVESLTVGFIEGSVFVIADETPAQKTPLTKAYSLQPGQQIQTEPGGTVEVLFPAALILRLGPSSRVHLFPAKGKQHPQHAVPAELLLGDAWVNATAMKQETPVEIAAGTCLLESDSGVFRITLHSDRSAEIKNYTSSLKVHGPLEPARPSQSYPSPAADSLPAPVTPSGKKWEQELPPLTKMVVWPNGGMTKPFRFAAKADQTAWVLWNQGRDKGQNQQP
ncbi:MAG: hypothetical protein RBT11_02175 [Desulfobacterales bacterium]|jgi:hypothetical protein|nr:hypothetical protein [Desulfobacterales bacterium]